MTDHAGAALTSRPTVAILDDDVSMTAAVSDILNAMGLNAESFATQQALLDRLRSSTFDAFILDWNLTHGTCLTTITTIRLELQHLTAPIFILSGEPEYRWIMPDDLVTTAGDLNLTYCQKPYSTIKLAKQIVNALPRHDLHTN